MLEMWKDVPDYEGIYQISNLGNVRTVERTVLSGRSHSVKKVMPSRLIKLQPLKKGNKVYARTMYQGKNVNIEVNSLVKKLFPKENPQLSLNLTTSISQNDFSKEILSIVDNWDTFSPNQIKSKLKELASMTFEQKEVGVSFEQIQSLKNQIISLFDSYAVQDTVQTVKVVDAVESKERWLPIKGTNNKYFVSDKGGFRRVASKGFQSKNKDSYIYPKGFMANGSKIVSVMYNDKPVNKNLSQLILNTFNNTNFKHKRVSYKNGNPKDCALSNIEWK